MNDGSIHNRLRMLCLDDRSYRRRWLAVLPPCVLLFFTFCIIGPIDIARYNWSDLYFSPADILLPCVLMGVGASLAVSALLALLKGWPHRLAATLIFGFGVCGYLQSLFFNPDVGAFDGKSIEWSYYISAGLLNLLIWAALLALAGVLCYLLLKKWCGVMRFISIVLTASQLAVLLAGLITSPAPVKQSIFLTGDEQFTVSDENNTFVFTLDYFSQGLFDQLLAEYPEVSRQLCDFTAYTDATSRYALTYPSLIYLLTREEYDPAPTTTVYLEKAWRGEKAKDFFGQMHQSGRKVNLYANVSYLGGDGALLEGLADNLTRDDISITPATVRQMLALSCYRYLPLLMKPSFVISEADVNNTLRHSANVVPVRLNHSFMNDLASGGLQVTDDEGRFVYHHLVGAHPPYSSDENGQKTEETDEHRQTLGYLRGIFTFMGALKKAGLYDGATILISADHGDGKDRRIAMLLKQPDERHDELQRCNAPVSQDNWYATLLDLMGLNGAAYGTPLMQADTAAATQRKYSHFYQMDGYPAVSRFTEIGQWNAGASGVHYNTLLTYLLDENSDRLNQRVAALDADLIEPLTDSFY